MNNNTSPGNNLLLGGLFYVNMLTTLGLEDKFIKFAIIRICSAESGQTRDRKLTHIADLIDRTKARSRQINLYDILH